MWTSVISGTACVNVNVTVFSFSTCGVVADDTVFLSLRGVLWVQIHCPKLPVACQKFSLTLSFIFNHMFWQSGEQTVREERGSKDT